MFYKLMDKRIYQERCELDCSKFKTKLPIHGFKTNDDELYEVEAQNKHF